MARRSVVALMVALALALVPSPSYAADDPLLPQQWGLSRIEAPQAWSFSTGSGVRIGIVDTGVDLLHEDLVGKVVESTNCVGAGDASRCRGTAQDDFGHGTHVSGIAAAHSGNGRGISGVAPGAELVVAKSLNADGRGTLEDVNAGIRWVVDHGADVVNLSLGDAGMIVTSVLGAESSLKEGIDYAWSRGAVPVVATGNSNLLGLGLEGGSYGGLDAIIVGASGPDDRMTGYSTSTGDAKWAVLAPGGAGTGNEAEDILSTYWERETPNAYRSMAGTSMAAPHVSGAVALLLAQGHTRESAIQRLLETVDARSACSEAGSSCKGRINVGRAVRGGAPRR